MADRYLEAMRRVPRGETRSFMELAAMAGRPGAARAAGRATRVAGGQDAPGVPWHRVVAADGGLDRDPERARTQLARLREEGARPRDGETVPAWAERRAVAVVGKLPDRIFLPPDDPRVERWSALRVEPLADEASARARGFRPHGGAHTPEIGASRRGRPRTRDTMPAPPIAQRLQALDWTALLADLAATGCCSVRGLLSPHECESILDESDRPDRFDRGVEMLAKGYGVGTYRYWREPLPDPLDALRRQLYARLREAAGPFRSGRSEASTYPETLDGFREECRAAGQRRPSSILIQYPERGVNHPHRDLYGKVWFPFQALVVLSRAGRDFDGGAFVLIEEREPRDLRREVPVSEGDLVVFGTRARLEGRRSIPLLHAMDPVTRGEREAVGLVFHLAE